MSPGKKLVLHWTHCLNTDLLGQIFSFHFQNLIRGFSLSVLVLVSVFVLTWFRLLGCFVLVLFSESGWGGLAEDNKAAVHVLPIVLHVSLISSKNGCLLLSKTTLPFCFTIWMSVLMVPVDYFDSTVGCWLEIRNALVAVLASDPESHWDLLYNTTAFWVAIFAYHLPVSI